MPRGGKKPDPKQVAAAVEAYKSGKSAGKIAAGLGLNQSTVHRWLVREGVEMRPVPPPPIKRSKAAREAEEQG